jgi:hypothetical protein
MIIRKDVLGRWQLLPSDKEMDRIKELLRERYRLKREIEKLEN